MILDEGALRALLHTVFTVYTAFWITVLVLLYFGVGLLLKRYDQTGKGH